MRVYGQAVAPSITISQTVVAAVSAANLPQTSRGASERGRRKSFKIVCRNFCKRLFLKSG